MMRHQIELLRQLNSVMSRNGLKTWLTTRQTVSQIATPANAQKLLNLPSGATAETLNTFVIPKGTTIYMGRVAGGGAKATQVFIENPNLLIQLGI